MRWVTRVLLAASTTPEPMAALCLQGVVAHLAVLAEEGEFPFDLGPSGLAKVAQRPD